jgi:hypothetical protein
MEINEEEFEKYLQTFVTDIWHMLMQVREGTQATGCSTAVPKVLKHGEACTA